MPVDGDVGVCTLTYPHVSNGPQASFAAKSLSYLNVIDVEALCMFVHV